MCTAPTYLYKYICSLPQYTCTNTHVHCPTHLHKQTCALAQNICTNTHVYCPNPHAQSHMCTIPTHLHNHTCALPNTSPKTYMCTAQYTHTNVYRCTTSTYLQKHTRVLPQYTYTNTHMSMVACTCKPRTVEVETGGSEVQSYPGLPEALSQKMFLKK